MLTLQAIKQLDPVQIFELLQELQRIKVQQEQEEAFNEANDVQMLSYLTHAMVQLEFMKAAYENVAGPGTARKYLASHRNLIDHYYDMVMADDSQLERIGLPDLPEKLKEEISDKAA